MVKRGVTWVPREVVPSRDNPTHPEQEERMRSIDRLKRRIRNLVNEYGADIVGGMLDDAGGPWDNAFLTQMEFDLKVWRYRRQEEWLATDFITPKAVESFARGLKNWVG